MGDLRRFPNGHTHTQLFLVLPSVFMESNLAVSHTGREGENGDWLFFQQQSLTEDSNRTHYSKETSGEIHGRQIRAPTGKSNTRLRGRFSQSQLYCPAVMTILTVWVIFIQVLYKCRD